MLLMYKSACEHNILNICFISQSLNSHHQSHNCDKYILSLPRYNLHGTTIYK